MRNRRLALWTAVGTALSLETCSVVVAEPSAEPRPNFHMQKALDEKGIHYQEWLLFTGIRSRRLDYVKAALAKGADPNTARDWLVEGIPPLFAAVSQSNADPLIVRHLIEHGARVNARWTPRTNLNRSELSEDQRSAFRGMLSTQNVDYFPLYYAVRYNRNPAVVEVLIELGADVNARTGNIGSTALFGTRDPIIADILVRHGANVNDRNNLGNSVLGDVKRSLQLMHTVSQSTRDEMEAYGDWLATKGAKE